MKRIYIDFTNYVEGKIAGANYYSHRLLNIFKKNNNYRVIAFVRDGQEIYFKRYSKFIKICKLKYSSDLFVFTWKNFIFPFLSLKSDLVIFPHNIKPIVFFKKNILIVHDLNFLYFRNNFSSIKKRIIVIIRKLSLLTSNVNITISDQIKKDILRRYKRKTIRIYNSVKKISKYPSLRSDIKKYKHIDYYLILTSLGKHKNLNNCLEAIKNYHKDNGKFYFIFIGNWERKTFKKFEDKKTIGYGYVSEEKKYELIKYANAILIPSLYEGFGLPYIEAAFAKKTLIASRIPVVEELLDEYPIYIEDPYNPREILEALKIFEKNKYSKKFLSENKLSKFSEERMSKNYHRVISLFFRN